jgi:hypothetical protein
LRKDKKAQAQLVMKCRLIKNYSLMSGVMEGKQRGTIASIGDIWGSTGFHGRRHPIHLILKNITKLLSKYQKSH